MAEHVRVWGWDTDAEGWTLTNWAWTGADGSDLGGISDPGCLGTFTPGGEGASAARSRTITLTGLTWEDLGVTSGAVVTSVQSAFRLKLVSDSGPFVDIDATLEVRLTSDDSLVATLFSDPSIAGGGSHAWETFTAPAQSVDVAHSASSTGIYLVFVLSSGVMGSAYSWQYRIDTLEITTQDDETPTPTSTSVVLPLSYREPFSRTAGLYQFLSTANGPQRWWFSDTSPFQTITSASWRITYAYSVSGGSNARLKMITPEGPTFGGSETNLPAKSGDGYTVETVALSGDQLSALQGPPRQNVWEIEAELTSGGGSGGFIVYEVALVVTGVSDPLLGAPVDFAVDGTWETDSGPPMQNAPVTIIQYMGYGNEHTGRAWWYFGHAMTDGTGAYSWEGRGWTVAAWVVPGHWCIHNFGTFAVPNYVTVPVPLPPNDHFAPFKLKECATPDFVSGALVNLSQNGNEPSGFPGRGPYAFASFAYWETNGVDYVTGGSVGTNSNGYRPRFKFYGQCNNGGAFNLPGVQIEVVGVHGSETITLDSNSEADLNSVDPQAILSLNPSGLPDCADLRDEPPYTQPTPPFVARGSSLAGQSIQGMAQFGTDRTFLATYVPSNIPAACGVNTWQAAIKVCATCDEATVIASMRLNADVHDPTGQIAVAWYNDSGALKVAINSEPATAIQEEDGKLGWRNIVTLESSNASDVGLVYLQNSRLFVRYDLSGSKKYRTTDKLGHGDAATWSAAATPDPAFSRHSDQGRGQQQACVFRGDGGTPDPWLGAGDIAFYQCRDNTGEKFVGPFTVVTGARGFYCGGSWIGEGYGCLYRKDSDGKAYWKTTPNPEDWGAGAGTDVSASISLLPIGLARHPAGPLCALLWDATSSKKCKVAVSGNRGVDWESSVDFLDAVPPLTHPPAIVCANGYFWIIWVANDQVVGAYSVDGGVTWSG